MCDPVYAPLAAELGGTCPVEKFSGGRVDVRRMGVAELKKVARSLGISIGSKTRDTLEREIAARLGNLGADT